VKPNTALGVWGIPTVPRKALAFFSLPRSKTLVKAGGFVFFTQLACHWLNYSPNLTKRMHKQNQAIGVK